MQPLSPCSECGGRRTLFECRAMQQPIFIFLGLSKGLFLRKVDLYACTCLTCGHTTMRIRPEDIGKLREAEEKGKAVQF